MSKQLRLNLMYDERLQSYGTIFNHEWAERLMTMVDGTRLDSPFFDLSTNWRAAVNVHAFPWMMMQSLAGLWKGHLKGEGFTPRYIRAMPTEIPRRMGGKMTNTARQRLGEVLQELADEVNRGIANDPELEMDAETMWRKFMESPMYEFIVAIWGSQRFCLGGLYHAYESYFREVLAIKKDKTDYRFRNFAQLVEHTTEEFGQDITDKCLTGDFLDISRWIRNSLAHNGGKENDELKKYRETKDHGIPVDEESGFLQIMAPHNERLITALEKRVTILTETALAMPEFK